MTNGLVQRITVEESTGIHWVKYLEIGVILEMEKNTILYRLITVKILKFGTPQTIGIIVLKIEKFDVTLH